MISTGLMLMGVCTCQYDDTWVSCRRGYLTPGGMSQSLY